MSTTTTPAHREATGPHYPMGVASRYRRPKGHLDPDGSKTWLRRVLPILMGHRAAFLTFIGLSFASSVFQILAPSVINRATTAIQTYVKLPAGTAAA